MQPQMLDTRVTRLLDANGVSYRILPHNEPVFTVTAAAEQRGVDVAEMVKSILLRDKDRRYVMACVRGNERLDPKALRIHLEGDWKRLSFASAEEIRQVTGYVQGAVAPLGLPQEIPIVFDNSIVHNVRVNISSGDPMAGLELNPDDLIKLSGAQLADITEKNSH
jgi:Cys-tRNA(Pro)/Cys-tRNA(Cys) deacylase